MKKCFLFLMTIMLVACGGGGGGSDAKPAAVADAAPVTTDTQPEEKLTNIDVPKDFDFSNFQTVTLNFTIPGDLVGQIDYKISGTWDNQVQDLYIGRGLANANKSITINVPAALTSVSIEYLVYHKPSKTYQVKIVEESI